MSMAWSLRSLLMVGWEIPVECDPLRFHPVLNRDRQSVEATENQEFMTKLEAETNRAWLTETPTKGARDYRMGELHT